MPGVLRPRLQSDRIGAEDGHIYGDVIRLGQSHLVSVVVYHFAIRVSKIKCGVPVVLIQMLLGDELPVAVFQPV